jgi:hypothetical protein
MAMGMSAWPKLSSSFMGSSTRVSATFPEAQEEIMLFMGIPASASATEAALIPAVLVPASA